MIGGRQLALELAERGDTLRPLAGGRLLDGQVLQGRGRLEQAGRRRGAEAGAQGGGGDGEVPEGRRGFLGWRGSWGAGLAGVGGARDGEGVGQRAQDAVDEAGHRAGVAGWPRGLVGGGEQGGQAPDRAGSSAGGKARPVR